MIRHETILFYLFDFFSFSCSRNHQYMQLNINIRISPGIYSFLFLYLLSFLLTFFSPINTRCNITSNMIISKNKYEHNGNTPLSSIEPYSKLVHHETRSFLRVEYHCACNVFSTQPPVPQYSANSHESGIV